MSLAWTAFLVYVVVTLVLAWLGSRKTGDLTSYAIGDRTMRPWVVGLALAASMTSTATFIINPGIVYAYGLSAVLGYGVSAGLGLMVGIVVLSKGFRRQGVSVKALTVPQWIALRWDNRLLAVFYAAVNLLLVSMVVLICYAMAGLLQTVLQLDSLVPGWGFEVGLFAVVLFVFSYTLWGGTFAHAYTNTAQGLIMIVVAVLLIGSGIHFLADGFLERLAASDPQLATVTAPSSILFRNLFEVFGVNLAVGLALACQPHFLNKALYVESERQVNRYLAVAVGAGVVFNLVLLCGLYARLGPEEAVARYVAESGLGIDGVMPAYIVQTFPPAVSVLVSVALLAAGMSTLDGILVALSAIVANDVFLVLRRGADGEADGEASGRLAFRVGRWTLVVLAVLTIVLALYQHRYKELSIALFAQEGVYAVLIATFVPVLFGIFSTRLPAVAVVASSSVALAVHFAFRYGELSILTAADYTNPGLTATYGLIASLVTAGLSWGWLRIRARSSSPSPSGREVDGA